MELQAYIRESRGNATQLAEALAIDLSFLSQMATGHRPISAERCVLIEKSTGGSVRRWDLRPDDWHRIWPELIGKRGAPAVPSERTA